MEDEEIEKIKEKKLDEMMKKQVDLDHIATVSVRNSYTCGAGPVLNLAFIFSYKSSRVWR